MSCCGQKRATLRARGRAARSREPRVGAPPRTPVDEPRSDQPVDVVEYLGDQAILAAGAKGRLYTFSPGHRSGIAVIDS